MNPWPPWRWRMPNLWGPIWATGVWTWLWRLPRCQLKRIRRSTSQAATFAAAASVGGFAGVHSLASGFGLSIGRSPWSTEFCVTSFVTKGLMVRAPLTTLVHFPGIGGEIGRSWVQLPLSAPPFSMAHADIMLDAFVGTIAGSGAPYQVRRTGCLPVRSGNIQLRRRFRLPRKYFSTRRRLPRTELCNLSPVPATSPSDGESEFAPDWRVST